MGSKAKRLDGSKANGANSLAGLPTDSLVFFRTGLPIAFSLFFFFALIIISLSLSASPYAANTQTDIHPELPLQEGLATARD